MSDFLQYEYYIDLCKILKQEPLVKLKSRKLINPKTGVAKNIPVENFPSYIRSDDTPNVIYEFEYFEGDEGKHLIPFLGFYLCIDNGDLYFHDRYYGRINLFKYDCWAPKTIGTLHYSELVKAYFDSIIKFDFTPMEDLHFSTANLHTTGYLLFDSLFKYIKDRGNDLLEYKHFNLAFKGWDPKIDKIKSPVFKGLFEISKYRAYITTNDWGSNDHNFVTLESLSQNPKSKTKSLDFICSNGFAYRTDNENDIKAKVLESILEATGNLQYEVTRESLSAIGFDKFFTNRELSYLSKHHNNYITSYNPDKGSFISTYKYFNNLVEIVKKLV